MKNSNNFYCWQNDTLILNLKVQPRASKDEFAEVMGNSIKVRITAPPIDGKANKHLTALLAKTFKVAKSRIELISGESSREKCIAIHSPQRLPAFITKASD
ncbi:MAG: DUF167 family protein [Gammaproteobacteria bacterium]|nr:DUF167 family protein [Gammaproteobacteria bacterium]